MAKSVNEVIKENLEKITTKYFEDLAKGKIKIDPDIYARMSQNALKLSRMGKYASTGEAMQGDIQKQREGVRENIRQRAAAREQTAMRFSNIASILAGGAESPISGLGRMQKMASKPFKASWEYQKERKEPKKTDT